MSTNKVKSLTGL